MIWLMVAVYVLTALVNAAASVANFAADSPVAGTLWAVAAVLWLASAVVWARIDA